MWVPSVALQRLDLETSNFYESEFLNLLFWGHQVCSLNLAGPAAGGAPLTPFCQTAGQAQRCIVSPLVAGFVKKMHAWQSCRRLLKARFKASISCHFACLFFPLAFIRIHLYLHYNLWQNPGFWFMLIDVRSTLCCSEDSPAFHLLRAGFERDIWSSKTNVCGCA